MPVDAVGCCKISDPLLIQLRDELLQLVACTFEVLAIVRVHIGRTSSSIGKSSQGTDK